MVPPEVVAAAAGPAAVSPRQRAKLQANGLPEGVKILPIAKNAPTPDLEAAKPEPQPAAQATPAETAPAAPATVSLVRPRNRIATPEDTAAASEATPAPVKRRKPGRPKAGRLDAPRAVAAVAPSSPAMPEPAAAVSANPAPANPLPAAPPVAVRRMSDLAPRRPAAHPRGHHVATPSGSGAPASDQSTEVEAPSKTAASKPTKRPKKARVHRVGVPPLHYAPVVAFSLRARARPRLVLLAGLATFSLGIAAAYGVWVVLNQGITGLADSLLHAGPRLITEVILLALMYYIGRSIGQTAIVYGIAREADQRPVTLTRQLGVAVNTFGRRLRLDLGFFLGELLLIAAGIVLFLTGGTHWPMDTNLQVGLLFLAYLVILYLMSALALSRGLAGVNLTLTTNRPSRAAAFGWRLFSHRVELVGPRFGAVLLEWLLALPLIVLGVALVLAAPPGLRLWVAVGAGLLAWLAGALMGVGTAAWWTMLYRQLIMADHPDSAIEHLSTRQPEEARRLPLSLIVGVSTLIIAAILLLPWLQLA